MALDIIDSREDISVTVVSSQCGRLCSSLDLTVLLEEDKEARKVKAADLAEYIRYLYFLSIVKMYSSKCNIWVNTIYCTYNNYNNRNIHINILI